MDNSAQPVRRHSLPDSPVASDPRHFRNCLGSFATGVTVVTTRRDDGRYVGLTVSSFNALSLDPALVLWSLGLRSRSRPAFEAARNFSISVLAADQAELALRFSGSAADRFAGVKLVESQDGAPLIDGALAWFECASHAQHCHGDHILFIGEVLRCGHSQGAPLVFQQGRFRGAPGAL